MSSQSGSRDKNGVLIGSFDQGWGKSPIDVLTHIVPFLYPCSKCKAMMFHVIGEQHAGIGIKVPFIRKPVASTGKGYHAICNTCTTINTQPPKGVVRKLEKGIIAREICSTYGLVCESPEPYTEGFTEDFIAFNPDADEAAVAFVRQCLQHYRREFGAA